MTVTAVWERVCWLNSKISPLPLYVHLPALSLWPYFADGESKKAKKNTGKDSKKKKKQKKNESEALEDSDDGDYEGLEVDYMSDESR